MQETKFHKNGVCCFISKLHSLWFLQHKLVLMVSIKYERLKPTNYVINSPFKQVKYIQEVKILKVRSQKKSEDNYSKILKQIIVAINNQKIYDTQQITLLPPEKIWWKTKLLISTTSSIPLLFRKLSLKD